MGQSLRKDPRSRDERLEERAAQSDEHVRIFLAEMKANRGNWICPYCWAPITIDPKAEAKLPKKKRLIVHHRDGNHSNNDPSNLVGMHFGCHTKDHLKVRGREKDIANSRRRHV